MSLIKTFERHHFYQERIIIHPSEPTLGGWSVLRHPITLASHVRLKDVLLNVTVSMTSMFDYPCTLLSGKCAGLYHFVGNNDMPLNTHESSIEPKEWTGPTYDVPKSNH
jgi:hypothetical protein